jgi:hypothetical protein
MFSLCSTLGQHEWHVCQSLWCFVHFLIPCEVADKIAFCGQQALRNMALQLKSILYKYTKAEFCTNTMRLPCTLYNSNFLSLYLHNAAQPFKTAYSVKEALWMHSVLQNGFHKNINDINGMQWYTLHWVCSELYLHFLTGILLVVLINIVLHSCAQGTYLIIISPWRILCA